MTRRSSKSNRLRHFAIALVCVLLYHLRMPGFTETFLGMQRDEVDQVRSTLSQQLNQLGSEYDAAKTEYDKLQEQAKTSPTGYPYAYTAWDEEASPDYYRIFGPAARVTTLDPGNVSYGSLDSLGRATYAQANVTYDLMESGIARERDDMSDLHPSGWGHNAEVNIELWDHTTYHGWFWNRSHLLAKSLGGGERLDNLITGTRMQNVGANDGEGGMAFPETLVRTYLQAHQAETVSYVATPIYEADELVPRSVYVDVKSSDGELDLCIEVYNAAKGYDIDYATGTFSQSVS